MTRSAGLDLLERAISYALGSLRLVPAGALEWPTPCRDWDLGSLLGHLDDSLLALTEAVDLGRVPLARAPEEPAGPAHPVVVVRRRARSLLGAWAGAAGPDPVEIGGTRLAAAVVSAAGAVEIAVHGWDVATACGEDRSLPPALAADLLGFARLLVSEDDRPVRFAAPVDPPPRASPADLLLAYLGRDPRRPVAGPAGGGRPRGRGAGGGAGPRGSRRRAC
ncbi:uncharacterized protein (TIGR03086 family) [Prauserella shujinwangii]|uniref:Uncharacterized protein (TIGR03086 family) n=1 Tax=Prauserella shujinwangii TaxID=1453103 RepID=A0A2T0M1C6_9PSEU|nr:TIGR03086 family metal-binding protein [Prauserella shujinwangii]PRX50371.1 uncharacterized protein (TIGR03086 family) [Prauserella shujinwangii]